MKRSPFFSGRARALAWIWAATIAAAPACDAGVNGRTGLGAMLLATGATLVEGTLSSDPDPTMNGGGPTVTIMQFHGLAFAGATNRALAGSIQQPARSVAFGLADDHVYWYVPAPGISRDVGANSDLLFSTALSYASSIPPGQHNLVLRAILADGRMGPATIQPVMISDFGAVMGVLDVRVTWNNSADLDLHVVAPVAQTPPPDPKAPTSIEVWVNNPSSLPPRPTFNPYTADEIAQGGVYQFDSNASCIIDGRDQEDVVWGGPPPPGMYTVRVDAISLCGEVGAQWQVDVFQNGNMVPVYTAFGEAVDSDTRFSHTTGSGVLALQFQIQ